MKALVLRNSCPYTTYPIFSSPRTGHLISPSTSSSLHRTDISIHPHSSQTPRSPKRNSVPILDASSCFTFLVLIRFALPPVLQSTGLHLVPRMFSSLDSAAAPHSLRSTGPGSVSPFYIVRFSVSFSHWFSEVVAYPVLRLGLVTSRSSYTGSVLEVISGRIRIESVVQVIFDV